MKNRALLFLSLTLFLLMTMGMLLFVHPHGLAHDFWAEEQAMRGSTLSAEDALNLEKQVAAHPTDVDARTKLLGYYFPRSHESPEAKAARRKHILWLIRNRPDASILESPYVQISRTEDPDAYSDAKKAWQDQVDKHPKNIAILGNTASFLFLDDRAMAATLYQQAQAIEPKNVKWPECLGHLYSLGLSSRTGDSRRRAAKQALDAYEQALTLSSQGHRFDILDDVANVAFEAESYEKARQYASESLKHAEGVTFFADNGDAIHHSNLILGRLALHDGDIGKAKSYLLAAGRTPGSPPLGSFGPNMMLAKELLEKGEQETVLEYFELCSKFWDRSRLEPWISDVRAGKIPDFGANLDY